MLRLQETVSGATSQILRALMCQEVLQPNTTSHHAVSQHEAMGAPKVAIIIIAITTNIITTMITIIAVATAVVCAVLSIYCVHYCYGYCWYHYNFVVVIMMVVIITIL